MILWTVGTISLSAQDHDYSNLTIEENIALPKVPANSSAAIKRHMNDLSNWFKEYNLPVSSVREGEVLVVTIPAERLFAPNLTTLTPQGEKLIDLFERAVNNPQSYRIIVALYADDTGDKKYSLDLTDARAEEVSSHLHSLYKSKTDAPNIYYYGMGKEKNVRSNSSIADRSANRRMEIYIIPEQKTIDSARAGRL